MKKFLWILSSAFLLSTVILSTGCGEDEDPTGPTISATDPTPSKVVEGTDTWVTFSVTAQKGNVADLQAITVYEGTSKLDFDTQVKVTETDAQSNPWTVSDGSLVTYEISVLVEAPAGEAHYEIEVSDKDGLTSSAEVHVIVEAAIEQTIEGVEINLYNQGGPVGRGGIDLDNGASTGTSLHVPTGDDSYLDAELRDMGLDLTQTNNPDLNWHQRIGGINGTVVRQITGGMTNSEFGGVASKQTIEDLYNEGAEFTATIPEYDFNVSEVVQAGDAFVVYKSSTETYYLVIVNEVVVTPGLLENNDHYNVSIKY